MGLFFLVCPSERFEDYILPLLTANSIWKSVSEILVMSGKQFPGHHSYFRQHFQKRLAVNIGQAQSPNRALGLIYQQRCNKI